ncbi:hypothetical protein RGCCGE502_21560 [Rhizobium grahamii CCGE 502]|uniref:Uncharacterized protein n=1 Tax=Rhizobium grahamii CCGE 502 TaxID=990285 RepID=S3IAB2_9HYPH|nr:hypothetical protein RGCCGE502_21560 [Rhizobium grahamii CCGE 502]
MAAASAWGCRRNIRIPIGYEESVIVALATAASLAAATLRRDRPGAAWSHQHNDFADSSLFGNFNRLEQVG